MIVMNTIIERLNAKSPKFFIQLKRYALKIGGSCAAVLVVNSTMSLNLNSVLITGLGYLVAVCVAVAGTSQLTKE